MTVKYRAQKNCPHSKCEQRERRLCQLLHDANHATAVEQSIALQKNRIFWRSSGITDTELVAASTRGSSLHLLTCRVRPQEQWNARAHRHVQANVASFAPSRRAVNTYISIGNWCCAVKIQLPTRSELVSGTRRPTRRRTRCTRFPVRNWRCAAEDSCRDNEQEKDTRRTKHHGTHNTTSVVVPKCGNCTQREESPPEMMRKLRVVCCCGGGGGCCGCVRLGLTERTVHVNKSPRANWQGIPRWRRTLHHRGLRKLALNSGTTRRSAKNGQKGPKTHSSPPPTLKAYSSQ